MKKILLHLLVIALSVVALSATSAFAEEKLTVIRIGTPSGSYGKALSAGPIGEIQVKDLFEAEFKKDGLRLDVQYINAAGPGVNEGLSNNALDFGSIGDLPAVAGFAGGLKTRAICSTRGGNTYVAVPADSRIKTIRDLKGKKIGVTLGTYLHAAAIKILHDAGLSENDVKFYNMDSTTAENAVITKDVDASFISSDAITMRTRGVARIIYTTQGKPVFYQNAGALIVRDGFAKKYPDIVRRFVKVWVKASYLHSKNKFASEKLDTRVGTPLSTLIEDEAGQSAVYLNSPLFDTMWLAHDRRSIALFKLHGLIRRTFDPEKEWIDRSYLNAALKELKLEKFWPNYDAAGNVIKR
jgi:sulfonate transport system substrate-binding protein